MDRRIRYQQTQALCEECLALVKTRICIENGNVYYLKSCPKHGLQKTLISTNAAYYRRSVESKPESFPRKTSRQRTVKGCPLDCGLCRNHKQRSSIAIIEITDDCNMRCSTCIAASYPGASGTKTLKEIDGMLSFLVSSEEKPDIVMISGGEPTIHPKIIKILSLAETKPIHHIMLATNGIRIAEDDLFIKQLRKIKNLEICLQFDSLRKKSLEDIRGQDLRSVHKSAIEKLNNANISTTLICVVKKGVTDTEMNEIIEFALPYKCVRGVTFQVIKFTGRHQTFEKEKHYVTLSEVREGVLRDSRLFEDGDLIPHPCNPENMSIGYLIRKNHHKFIPVTRSLFSESFEHYEQFRNMIYFLPKVDSAVFNYRNLFRVMIVSFLDKFNFSVRSAKRSCIHFITLDKRIIPLDTYYLFHSKAGD